MQGYNVTVSKCPHCLVANVELYMVFNTGEADAKETRNFKIWYTYQCKLCKGVIVAYRYGFEKDMVTTYPMTEDVVSTVIATQKKIFLQWDETNAYTDAKIHRYLPKSVSGFDNEDWEQLHASDMSAYIRLKDYIVRLEEYDQ